MSIGLESSLADVRDEYHALVLQLRGIEHWRRLLQARLDLAVAAVTRIDELAALPDGWRPEDPLRDLIGLPAADDPPTDAALSETALLVRIRAALDQLDAHATQLRRSTELTSQRW